MSFNPVTFDCANTCMVTINIHNLIIASYAEMILVEKRTPKPSFNGNWPFQARKFHLLERKTSDPSIGMRHWTSKQSSLMNRIRWRKKLFEAMLINFAGKNLLTGWTGSGHKWDCGWDKSVVSRDTFFQMDVVEIWIEKSFQKRLGHKKRWNVGYGRMCFCGTQT